MDYIFVCVCVCVCVCVRVHAHVLESVSMKVTQLCLTL